MESTQTQKAGTGNQRVRGDFTCCALQLGSVQSESTQRLYREKPETLSKYTCSDGGRLLVHLQWRNFSCTAAMLLLKHYLQCKTSVECFLTLTVKSCYAAHVQCGAASFVIDASQAHILKIL